jgi:hypothetical protein
MPGRRWGLVDATATKARSTGIAISGESVLESVNAMTAANARSGSPMRAKRSRKGPLLTW